MIKKNLVGRDWSYLQFHRIPKKSGVYLMRNQFQEIIYIGKAKNLYKRVRSYFYKTKKQHHKISKLTFEIEKIDFIITDTELEALLLESKLIKKYLPKYNRQIRNYKSYPFIKININNQYPRVYVTNNKIEDENYYFGPFKNRRVLDEEVKLINRIFGTRSCQKNVNINPQDRSCFYYQLNQCKAPCIGKITKSKYKKLIDDIIHFIEKGEKSKDILKNLLDEQKNLISELQFEKAKKIQDNIDLLKVMIRKYKRLNKILKCLNSIIIYYDNELYTLIVIVEAKIKKSYRLRDIPQLLTNLEEVLSNFYQPDTNLFQEQFYYSNVGIEKEELDEMNIIVNWVRSHQKDSLVTPLKKIDHLIKAISAKNIQTLPELFTLTL